jgi:hypothetical protein
VTEQTPAAEKTRREKQQAAKEVRPEVTTVHVDVQCAAPCLTAQTPPAEEKRKAAGSKEV